MSTLRCCQQIHNLTLLEDGASLRLGLDPNIECHGGVDSHYRLYVQGPNHWGRQTMSIVIVLLLTGLIDIFGEDVADTRWNLGPLSLALPPSERAVHKRSHARCSQ